jgi:hypothetical protein
MNYTLDSVEHAKECLKQELNIKKIDVIPIFCPIHKLEYSKENIFYFGVFTLGPNIDILSIESFGMTVLEMESNSQGYFLFKNAGATFSSGNIPFGQFRGFQLICENSSVELFSNDLAGD